MTDDVKNGDDAAHQTMPPELRPFAKPVPPQRLVAPENEPRFNAAIGALQVLNGGPKADPFYVDPKKAPVRSERQASESVKAYVPPTVVPAAEAQAREAAPAKVVISEASEGNGVAATRAEGEAADEITLVKNEKPQDTPASPWAKEAPLEAVEEGALPSSLGPREVLPAEGEAPVSTQAPSTLAAGAPSPVSRTKVVIAVVVAIVIGVWVLRTAVTSESPAPGPAPRAMPTVTAPAVEAPAPVAPTHATVQVAPPPASVTAAPSPEASTTRTQGRGRVVPKPPSATDDPYADAAVKPLPPVTVAPVAPVSPQPTSSAPVPPQSTTSVPDLFMDKRPR